MKEFRKSEDDLFICEECGILYKSKVSLSWHLRKNHINIKYFDKWLKEEDEELCKICKEPAKFISNILGYKNGCCKKHNYLYSQKIRKQTCLEKYSVEYALQSPKVKEKGKNTCLKKYK